MHIHSNIYIVYRIFKYVRRKLQKLLLLFIGRLSESPIQLQNTLELMYDIAFTIFKAFITEFITIKLAQE